MEGGGRDERHLGDNWISDGGDKRVGVGVPSLPQPCSKVVESAVGVSAGMGGRSLYTHCTLTVHPLYKSACE